VIRHRAESEMQINNPPRDEQAKFLVPISAFPNI
jgi:hypothetical protein